MTATKRKERLKRPFTRVYQLLVQTGFSPFKAAEIVLDAKRGDTYARAFVGVARRTRLSSKHVDLG